MQRTSAAVMQIPRRFSLTELATAIFQVSLIARTQLAHPSTGSGLNTVRLTVRGELVEPPVAQFMPFDNAFSPEQSRRVRANGIFLKRTVLGQV